MKNNHVRYDSKAVTWLCIAVLQRAVQDYATARTKLAQKPDDAESLSMLREVKAFFTGDWADFYTSPFGKVDGEMLLSKLSNIPVEALDRFLPKSGHNNNIDFVRAM